jgi:hypothetical protein
VPLTAFHGLTLKARRGGDSQGALNCLALNLVLSLVNSNRTHGNFRHSVSVVAGSEPSREGAEMIRDLFIAFVMLVLTVAATAWGNSGPRLSVQQVEASLAR